MRFASTLSPVLAALCLGSCEEHQVEYKQQVVTDNQPISQESPQTSYDEVWMMRGWQGYMCVVLAITGDHCDQWFISDAGQSSEMKEPQECEVRKIDGGIRLTSEDPNQLYATTWNYVVDGDEQFLASEDDIKAERDKGRWLRRIDPKAFTKYLQTAGPFVLHMNPKLEANKSEQATPLNPSD